MHRSLNYFEENAIRKHVDGDKKKISHRPMFPVFLRKANFQKDSNQPWEGKGDFCYASVKDAKVNISRRPLRDKDTFTFLGTLRCF